MNKRERQESKENEENSRKVPQQVNFLVGNYRPRRAERWENVPRVPSEVSEI